MAGTELNIDAYIDALVVLGTAGIVVPVVRRFGGSAVLGYLAAGAALGPLGLGSIKYDAPILLWTTIADARNVAGIAELGVVFLLFLIGLELSLGRLLTMRRLVFGLGGLQVAISTAAISGILGLLGVKPATAVILGLCLALSSTAIVLDILSGHRRMATVAGRTSFAVLLAQDLAVVPMFLLIGALAAGGNGSVVNGLVSALLHALVALSAITLAGRFLLRPMLRQVAALGATELFTAATLFVVVISGVAAAVAGLSMALGAFVAGLMLAETEYRKAIEAIMEPFKALLLGIFFFTIGMKIDVRAVLADPLTIAAAVVGLIVLKGIILFPLMRLFRVSRPAALEGSLLLGPGGEFAFVGIGLASAAKLIDPPLASLTLAVTAISMVMIPLLANLARRIDKIAADPVATDTPLLPATESGHTIVIGHGRVGRTVVEMLERHKEPFIATDSNPETTTAERRRGRPVFYGNATDPGYLESCGLGTAKAVVLTIHDRAAIDEIVRSVRQHHPDLTIVARARDADHARHLYAIGVTDAVPETIEASLQLSEAVLVGIGVPTGPVIASIHEKRDEFRHTLQAAATEAGRTETRSVRPKTLPKP